MKIFPINIKAAPNPEQRETLLALAQTTDIPSLAEVQKLSPERAIYT